MTTDIISERRSRVSGRMVLGLSACALLLTIWVAPRLSRWELAAGDLFVRVRLHLLHEAGAQNAHPDLHLLAMDNRTQEDLGRYRGGNWVARKPFADQTRFFREYMEPSVVAYDVIFADALGRRSREEGGATQVMRRLQGLQEEVAALSTDTEALLSSRAMADLGVLLSEHGTSLLMHRFAGILESEDYSTVLAYNFRGGYLDPQLADIPWWSDEDVFGGHESGSIDYGLRIPYLIDIAIPERWIAELPAVTRALEPAHNALFPALELIDYVRLGSINVSRDPDGVVRRVPLVQRFEFENRKLGEKTTVTVPSFSLLAAMLHLGFTFPLEPERPPAVEVAFGDAIVLRPPGQSPIRIPIDVRGQLLLNFDVAPQDFAWTSFSRVAPSYLDTSFDARSQMAAATKGAIDGRLVVVGDVSTGSTDLGPTPIGQSVPYIFVHMVTLNNILSGQFLKALPRDVAWLLAMLGFLFFTFVALRVRAAGLPILVVVAVLTIIVAGYLGVARGAVRVPVLAPLAYVVLSSFLIMTFRYAVEERRRREIRGMFSTMVSPKVLSYLEENPESFSLAGRQVEGTVFFSDVVNFTTLSESLSPAQVSELMNVYLTAVSDCMLRRDAYIDKYVGDLVMAVWGAPYPQDDHAQQACLAALDQQRLLERSRPLWRQRFGVDLHVRIGLNSGQMVAGNMGSERKMNYSVIGDVVNLASRLEPVNKLYGTSILIGEETRKALDERFIVRRVDRIAVKGRLQAIDVFELVGMRNDVGAARVEALACYEAAWDAYSEGDWDRALALLAGPSLAHDAVSVALVDRVKATRQGPAASNWTPVRSLDQK